MNVMRELEGLTPEVLERDVKEVDVRVREGRFQRWLALIAGLSSVLAGLEVSYEHYRGSYSNRIMYTPVILSGALAGAGVWGFFSRWAATWLLRSVSVITLADSVTGLCISHPRRAAKAGRLAAAREQHHHGAAVVCAFVVRGQRLSRPDSFVLTARPG